MPDAAMRIGRPTKGYKSSTIVLVTRGRRSKWWHVVCFGQKGHYRKADGGCEHTDQAIANLNPETVALDRVRLVPFGDKTNASSRSERP